MNSFDGLDHRFGSPDQGQSGWDFLDLWQQLGSAIFTGHGGHSAIEGTPGSDAHYWVPQTTPFTCDVVSQEMILHEFGINASEAQLTYEATAHGWLTDGGTSMENMSRLLEMHGVSTHTVADGSVSDLLSELAQGHKVIAAVDSGEMWKTDLTWSNLFGSQSADHAIVITGLDMSDSSHPRVYINDPGDPAGAGKAYPLDQFLNAWGHGGDLYVATDSAPVDLSNHSILGSNFNSASGMYMNEGFWQTFLTELGQGWCWQANLLLPGCLCLAAL
jgi:hypothetical protein